MGIVYPVILMGQKKWFLKAKVIKMKIGKQQREAISFLKSALFFMGRERYDMVMTFLRDQKIDGFELFTEEINKIVSKMNSGLFKEAEELIKSAINLAESYRQVKTTEFKARYKD